MNPNKLGSLLNECGETLLSLASSRKNSKNTGVVDPHANALTFVDTDLFYSDDRLIDGTLNKRWRLRIAVNDYRLNCWRCSYKAASSAVCEHYWCLTQKKDKTSEGSHYPNAVSRRDRQNRKILYNP